MRSWRAIAASLAVAAVLLAAMDAKAFAAEEPTHAAWYGAPVLVMDAAAVTTMTTGWVGMRNADVWLAGAGLHLVGAPIVHVIHGHPLRALGSFGLRVGGLLLGSLVGGYLGGAFARPNTHCGDTCGYDGLGAIATGAVVGVDVTATGVSVLDAALLSYETPHAHAAGSLVPYVGGAGARSAPLSISLGESAPGGFISPRMAFATDTAQRRTPVFGVGGRF
jgi:hypothetical protein